MRIIFIVCGIIARLIACLFIWGWIARTRELKEIRPYITYTRLIGVAQACDKYKEQYGVWPNSLAQLRVFRPEMSDWAKDSWGQGDNVWGRDVVLVPYDKSLGYGEVISYGRDGKPGGSGADQDMIIRFPCEANTNWNEQVGAGLKRPQRAP